MSAHQRSRVMIVESNWPVAAMMQEELSAEGYDVDLIVDPATAIRALRETSPDVIVIEVGAAGTNASDTLHEIACMDIRIPVILHTGSPVDRFRLGAWSAADCVLKSGDLSTLLTSIRRQLSTRVAETTLKSA